MTNFSQLSSTFQQLQGLAPEAFTPIASEADLISATAFLQLLDREIGDTVSHPLAPLAETLMQRIMAYEVEHYPIPPAAPDMELRLLMKEHGVTQQGLSEATGIDQGQISKLTSGKRTFTAEHARRLGRHFKVSPSVFL
ncbi:helix-turn-helix domain-containing protein [Deinococcus sp.]|uniref:helix-turn-helix domain-containing protein n=1 Tax=Deinococcus sp. TaxID=47478 RepID=UPI0025EF1369|nr:helix-turn-helix domain-containing protein [Deinococcus sp.]